MSRHALILAEAIEPTALVESTLARYGIDSLRRARQVSDAVDLLAQAHVDVVFVAVDQLTDTALAQVGRAIRRESHTEVVGTAASSDPELMLRAMRAGIQEFLVRPVNPVELANAMDRVSRRRGLADARGQVIACYSTKGGVGVSAVVANLATALAAVRTDLRVAVADLVVPNGDQRLLFNGTVSYDIADVVGRAERLDAEFLNSVVAGVRDGVSLLASSERAEVADLVDASVVTAMLQHVRTTYSYTLVDCEHHLNERTLAALDAADRILFITQLDVSSLRGTQRALALFRRLGYPSAKVCVVVNRYDPRDVLTLSDAASVLKSEVYFRIPNAYKPMAEALSRGVSVAHVDGGRGLAAAFEELARKIGGPTDAAAEASAPGSRLRSLFARKRA